MADGAAVPVVDAAGFLSRAAAARRRVNPHGCGMKAMYSSWAGAIVTDPALMTLPVDDHAIVRGHALFDTAIICKGRVYRLDAHLSRMFAGAAKARLRLPFPGGEEENRRRITHLVRHTCAVSGLREGSIRYWLTAGPGNFAPHPSGCEPSLYICVFGATEKGGAAVDPSLSNGMSEVVMRPTDVPLKGPFYAGIKSNNYLPNTLLCMAARERGGNYGVQVDERGNLMEGAVLGVFVVGRDGVLRTPPHEFGSGILRSCTVIRCLELARERLVPAGRVRGVEQAAVPEAALRGAAEVFFAAGDTHVFPIVKLDGVAVGDGKPGPVFTELNRLVQEDAATGTGHHHTVPYEAYPAAGKL